MLEVSTLESDPCSMDPYTDVYIESLMEQQRGIEAADQIAAANGGVYPTPDNGLLHLTVAVDFPEGAGPFDD